MIKTKWMGSSMQQVLRISRLPSVVYLHINGLSLIKLLCPTLYGSFHIYFKFHLGFKFKLTTFISVRLIHLVVLQKHAKSSDLLIYLYLDLPFNVIIFVRDLSSTLSNLDIISVSAILAVWL